MSPQQIAALGNAAISICFGLIAMLYGFRVLGARPGENYRWDEWHRKWEKPLEVLGPLLMAITVLVVIGQLVRGQ